MIPFSLAQVLGPERLALRHLNDQIAHCDAEIAKWEHIKSQAGQKRRNLIWKMAPVRRLPAEVLLEICTLLAVKDSRHCVAPSQVCKFWRQILIGYPFLWTNLVVHCGTNLGWREQLAPTIYLLFTFMKRMKNQPFDARHSVKHSSYTLGLLDVVLPHLLGPKLRSMEVTLRTKQAAILVQHHLNARPLPLLQTIKFYLSGQGYEEVEDSEGVAYTSSEEEDEVDNVNEGDGLLALPDFTLHPSLRGLTIAFSCPTIQISAMRVNWLQLTFLDIKIPTKSHAYMEVLPLCCNLKTLHVAPKDNDWDEEYYSDDEKEEEGTIIPKAKFDHLKVLKLDAINTPALLLHKIIAPSLKELQIYIKEPFFMYDVADQYDYLFDHIGPNLHVLRISGHIFWALVRSVGLATLPQLTHLQLVGPFQFIYSNDGDMENVDDTELWSHFIVKKNEAPAVPKLEVLEVFNYSDMLHETRLTIAKMIGSRGPQSGGALRKVVFTTENDISFVVDTIMQQERHGLGFKADPILGFN